ncbi:MAG: hypothetical protein R2860_12170 [Desulfobacterales bacterium]
MGANIADPEKTALVFVNRTAVTWRFPYQDIFINVNRLSRFNQKRHRQRGPVCGADAESSGVYLLSVCALSVGAAIVPVDP